MALLPELGETKDTAKWSRIQLVTFCSITYIIVFLFLVATLMAISNI